MSRKLEIALAILALTGFVIGSYGVFCMYNVSRVASYCDTTTYFDTIPYYQPVPKDSAVIRYVTRTLPVKGSDNVTTNKIPFRGYLRHGPVKSSDNSTTNKSDTFLAEKYAQNNGENIPPLYASVDSDSAAVAIPITQKRYDGDDYLAYVSGYEPNLDSIFVFPKTTVIHERSYKPPNKWHIGITGGYGYGIKSKQAEPYIGIGITYSIISF